MFKLEFENLVDYLATYQGIEPCITIYVLNLHKPTANTILSIVLVRLHRILMWACIKGKSLFLELKDL